MSDIDEQPGGRGEGLPASPGEEKWLGGRKWTGIAAVAVLALTLLVGGVVVFSDTRPPPASSPAATVLGADSARVAGTPVSDADVVVILSKHQDQIDDLTTLVEELSAQLAAIRSHLAAGPGWSDD